MREWLFVSLGAIPIFNSPPKERDSRFKDIESVFDVGSASENGVKEQGLISLKSRAPFYLSEVVPFEISIYLSLIEMLTNS